ncbi:AGE family epimerase/isomerase [Angustibacter sp. McL0619]|uniref:AGE family epimerase/isomerase n=1 Tax=Angustibacter sp. McL0619 TaxID=3415676 RepID=UPI003CE8D7E2
MSRVNPAPPTPATLDAECRRLIAFAMGAVDPRGGFGWMDDAGVPDPTQPVLLLINTRMTHVFGLAHLLGTDGALALAERGVQALTGLLHDDTNGGWWSAVDADGNPLADQKLAYDHAFVLLAGSTAVQASVPGGEQLLAEAVAMCDEHFWDEEAGACVEQWDGAWQQLDGYRGANANMHSVEAFLAVADATGDPRWLDRASRIAGRLIDAEARAHGWRLPEHYDATWTPDLDYARDNPDDQFRPFGSTVGHGLEWSRLLLHLDAALARGGGSPDWLVPAARSLFETAVRDGWHRDGTDGFVYTVDWDGDPVVRQRMHWVVAEGMAAAAALHRGTGDPAYLDQLAQWWQYTDRHLLDLEGGWRHELDPANRPAATVWPGKPDAYHAVQAMLVPRLPLAPGMAAALRQNLLEAPRGE